MDEYMKWLPVFTKIQNDWYEKSDPKMSCHDVTHHMRVWRSAKEVGKNYEHDPEILLAACMLHDISAHRSDLYFDESKTQVNDAMLAEGVLREVGFPKEKIHPVIECIRWHGSDPSYAEKRTTIEGKLLCDADKLEALGPIGISRIFSALVNRGFTIHEIVEKYHDNGKLERKYNAICLPEFKDLAEEDYKYSKKFFADLAKTLELV